MKHKNKFYKSVIVLVVIIAVSVMESKAQDWPQWRGQNRDGVINNTGVNPDWTENKPPLLWTFREAGAGYSTPAIAGTMLYCQGAADGNDFAFALDTETGKLKWKQELGKQFLMDRGNGPRGTITIDGDRLYLVRGGGQIHCISAVDGKTIWQKDFRTDLGGNIMSQWDWGFSESPLVDGNLVISTPGGSEGTLAALDKKSGEVVWRSIEWTDLGGYSSAIVAEIDGVRQYIQLTSKGVAGVAAKDGKLLWSADVAGNRTAAIPTPICHNNIVYVTSGYMAGCAGLRLTKNGDKFSIDTLYVNKNMTNHHGGVVLIDGHIYGFSDNAGWVCQNLETGEIVWKQRLREPGKGAVTGVNNRLLCLDERTGSLTVASVSPEGWKEFGRMEIPERSGEESAMDNMVWSHPAVANGKLYIRDHNLLFCFDLKKD